MERVSIKSSLISEIGYDPETSTLEVLFSNGGVYRYFDVPPEKAFDLHHAESIGKYFGQHIRGKFKFEKHEPEAAEGASA